MSAREKTPAIAIAVLFLIAVAGNVSAVDFNTTGSGTATVNVTGCIEGSTQQCGTTDVGRCSYGIQTCSGNSYGECVGEVIAVTEVCDNLLDDNCDGLADEDCPVTEPPPTCGDLGGDLCGSNELCPGSYIATVEVDNCCNQSCEEKMVDASILDFEFDILEVGTPVSPMVRVVNTGNTPGEFLIEVTITADQNTVYQTKQTTTEIGAGKIMEISMQEAWIPEKTGSHLATINIYSADKQQQYDTQEAIIWVSGELVLEVTFQIAEPRIDTPAFIETEITNTGTVSGELLIEAVITIDGQTVYQEEQATAEVGAGETLNTTIEQPWIPEKTGIYLVTLNTYSTDKQQLYDTQEATIWVSGELVLEVTFQTEEPVVDSPATLDISITTPCVTDSNQAENSGCVGPGVIPEAFLVEITISIDGEILYQEEQATAEIGASETLNTTIEQPWIPEKTGIYLVTINVYSADRQQQYYSQEEEVWVTEGLNFDVDIEFGELVVASPSSGRVSITNTGSTPSKFLVEIIISKDGSIVYQAEEVTKEVMVDEVLDTTFGELWVPPSTGMFTVRVNVYSADKRILYDSIEGVIWIAGEAGLSVFVSLDEENKEVVQGGTVSGVITVLNIGTVRPLDTFLEWSIVDAEARTFVKVPGELLNIEIQVELVRNIEIPENLPPGEYFFLVRASHKEIEETSAESFEVVGKPFTLLPPGISFEEFLEMISEAIVRIVLDIINNALEGLSSALEGIARFLGLAGG